MSALDPNFVRGKRIGWNGTLTDGSPLKLAYDALVAGGAIMVERPVITSAGIPGGSVLNYEAHRDIDHYYAHLGPDAPIKSLQQENDDNLANPMEALKFGNSTHAAALAIDISPHVGGLDRLPRPAAAGQDPHARGDRPDDDQRHRRSGRRLHRDPRHASTTARAPATRS